MIHTANSKEHIMMLKRRNNPNRVLKKIILKTKNIQHIRMTSMVGNRTKNSISNTKSKGDFLTSQQEVVVLMEAQIYQIIGAEE